MFALEGSTGPIVVDMGSSTIRAGFAGCDRPSVVESSLVSFDGQTNAFPVSFYKPQTDLEVRKLWKQSSSNSSVFDIADDDSLYAALSGVISKTRSPGFESKSASAMSDEPTRDNAVLISEPSMQNNAYRQKVVQLLFEKLGCRGAFVSKRSVLSAFSVGKINAMVVSCGAAVTNVSCIVGGHSNSHLSVSSSLAGDAVDAEIYSRLHAQNPQISFLPKLFASAQLHQTKSFVTAAQAHYVRQLKEEVCRVAENKDIRVSVGSSVYELPDGTVVDCSKVTQSVPEILFGKSTDQDTGKPPFSLSMSSLVKEVNDRCKASDENLASSLLGSVVVCGGTSTMPGFVERMQNDLSSMYSQKEVKCVAGSGAVEKRHSAWIGGSIVASLGNFSSLWITKKEYDEHGIGIVGKKCP